MTVPPVISARDRFLSYLLGQELSTIIGAGYRDDYTVEVAFDDPSQNVLLTVVRGVDAARIAGFFAGADGPDDVFSLDPTGCKAVGADEVLIDFDWSEAPADKTSVCHVKGDPGPTTTACTWCGGGGLGGGPSPAPSERFNVASVGIGLGPGAFQWDDTAAYEQDVGDTGGGSNCPRCGGTGVIPIVMLVTTGAQ